MSKLVGVHERVNTICVLTLLLIRNALTVQEKEVHILYIRNANKSSCNSICSFSVVPLIV